MDNIDSSDAAKLRLVIDGQVLEGDTSFEVGVLADLSSYFGEIEKAGGFGGGLYHLRKAAPKEMRPLKNDGHAYARLG